MIHPYRVADAFVLDFRRIEYSHTRRYFVAEFSVYRLLKAHAESIEGPPMLAPSGNQARGAVQLANSATVANAPAGQRWYNKSILSRR